jgi:glycerol-3-phosphate acyltransferase PlsX
LIIAVDAMGGDYAPQEIVAGTVQAVCDFPDVSVILAGPVDRIKQELAKYTYPKERIFVEAADDTIEMDEHPVTAVRKKKNASVVVANRLVKEGRAQAVISAGNTGAAMASSLFVLGRIKGIERPAIAIPLPTMKGASVLLDAGANADCDPENLAQFAAMGSIYAEKVLGKKFPRVALLSIGEEETKGNKLTVATHQLLKNAPINFVGNIEGKDIPAGDVDVIVCDGFVGNTVLKFMEGLATSLFVQIKDVFLATPLTKLAAAILQPGLRKLSAKLDYSEYGGAILLGIDGISIISHGRSNAKAIRNAIRSAKQAVAEGVVASIPQLLTGPTAKEREEQ